MCPRVTPSAVGHLEPEVTEDLHTSLADPRSAVVLFSGGIDSTTLVYKLLSMKLFRIHLLNTYYGQRHAIEQQAAQRIAFIFREQKGLSFSQVDLSSLFQVAGEEKQRSVLLNHSKPMPHGHYADETMKQTVVPYRNLLLATVGAINAAMGKFNCVAIAAHAGDHAIYPDCRPEFFRAMQGALSEGIEDGVKLYTPFLTRTKTDIVNLGFRLDVPYHLTWSCYDPQRSRSSTRTIVDNGDPLWLHCGKCGTCVERKEAFELAGVPDPTRYVVCKPSIREL